MSYRIFRSADAYIIYITPDKLVGEKEHIKLDVISFPSFYMYLFFNFTSPIEQYTIYKLIDKQGREFPLNSIKQMYIRQKGEYDRIEWYREALASEDAIIIITPRELLRELDYTDFLLKEIWAKLSNIYDNQNKNVVKGGIDYGTVGANSSSLSQIADASECPKTSKIIILLKTTNTVTMRIKYETAGRQIDYEVGSDTLFFVTVDNPALDAVYVEVDNTANSSSTSYTLMYKLLRW